MNGGIVFNITCYRDKFEEFICKCYDMIREIDYSSQEKNFNSCKENKLKLWNNFYFTDPYSQAWTYLYHMVFNHDYPNELLIKNLESFTFDRFLELSEDFIKYATHLWFLNGNLTPEDAIRISKAAQSRLPTKNISRAECYQKKVVCLQSGLDTVLKIKSSNSEDNNSSLTRYYQLKPETNNRQYVLHRAVLKYIENPAFDYLRTQLQLGYIAYSCRMEYRGVLGAGFYVQSSDYSPEQILTYIQKFLENYRTKISEISDEDYDKCLNGVIKDLRHVDMNIFETKSRLWSYIADHSYQFNKENDCIEILDRMLDKEDQEEYSKGKEELKQFFYDVFFNDPKIITVEIIAQNRYDQFEQEFEENSDIGGVKREVVQNILKWRNSQMEYPDLFKCKWE